MGIKRISRKFVHDDIECDVCEFIADTEEDMDTPPAAGCGSTAVVIASGNAYMVKTDGTWGKVGGA